MSHEADGPLLWGIRIAPPLAVMFLWGYGNQLIHDPGGPTIAALMPATLGMIGSAALGGWLGRGPRRGGGRDLALWLITLLIASITGGLAWLLGCLGEVYWRANPAEGMAPPAGRALWHALASFALFVAASDRSGLESRPDPPEPK